MNTYFLRRKLQKKLDDKVYSIINKNDRGARTRLPNQLNINWFDGTRNWHIFYSNGSLMLQQGETLNFYGRQLFILSRGYD